MRTTSQLGVTAYVFQTTVGRSSDPGPSPAERPDRFLKSSHWNQTWSGAARNLETSIALCKGQRGYAMLIRFIDVCAAPNEQPNHDKMVFR
jgi:hypothetical protein